MYAVIRTGGKQSRVEQGQRLDVELLGKAEGDEVDFTPVLVVDGESVVATASDLASAKVTARVVGEHETHHVAVLQAGARALGEAIGRGEYELRRRRQNR